MARYSFFLLSIFSSSGSTKFLLINSKGLTGLSISSYKATKDFVICSNTPEFSKKSLKSFFFVQLFYLP